MWHKTAAGTEYTREHVALVLSAPPLIAGAPPKLTHFVPMPFGRCTKCVQTWTLAPAAMLALRPSLLSFAVHALSLHAVDGMADVMLAGLT